MSAASRVLDCDDFFMAVAFLAAKRSADPISRVGVCIVNENNVIVGVGYNEMPRGCSSLPWDKDSPNPLVNKHLYVCYATLNAITNKNSMDIKNCVMYTNLFPSNECAKNIIQNGIKEVIYFSDKYKTDIETQASRIMLEMAKVKLTDFKQLKPDFALKIEIDFSDIEIKSMEVEKLEI